MSSNETKSTLLPLSEPNKPKIALKWTDLGLSDHILKLVESAGFPHPTEVQAQSIPPILAGHDVIVSSQTGSGKTASFVLPTVARFAGTEGTFGLVLAPTREIAQQTQTIFEIFGAPLGLRSVALIGGVNLRQDEEALRTYPQIVVATPGRLCDHLDRGNIWLEFIKILVLDEADRMLKMGFADQLSRIMEDLPTSRQTLLFSATFAPQVQRLVQKLMKTPKVITIGVLSSAPPKIDQRLIWVQEENKLSELMKILRDEHGTIIVFLRSKDRASHVWRLLHSRQIYDATYIHSDCTQTHREQALADFRSGKFRILVATDIAGRGIDIDDVAHVINYDLPLEADDYVHRIGRTGRKGKSGIATSLVTYRDRELLRKIEITLGSSFNDPTGQLNSKPIHKRPNQIRRK